MGGWDRRDSLCTWNCHCALTWKEDVISVIPYVLPPAHGGQLRQIAAQYGIPAERLLDFSANINPAGPPLSVLSAIRKVLDEASTLAQYPDLELAELKIAV